MLSCNHIPCSTAPCIATLVLHTPSACLRACPCLFGRLYPQVNTTLVTSIVDANTNCVGGLCSFNATNLLQDTAYDFQIFAHNR
jgi:hypothetical protein